MWLGSAGVLLRRALQAAGLLHDDSFATVLAFYRLPVVLAHTAAILAGYALLRRMLPALVAALAALLWAADPFVIAYSRVLHVDGLAHAFTNTLLYLDWDRRGFPWPVLPFAINCYGRNLIHAKGGMAALFLPPRDDSELPDPPAPQPWRCMEVGRAVAEILAQSPWRVALIASSSWSHCFLSPTNGYLWPDHAADRLMFDALSRGDYGFWRKRSLKDMEQAGQHEMLNWMALAGAMEALDRKPVVHDYVETHLFMSEKCFVSYPAPN